MPDSSTVALSDMLGTYRIISSFFSICRLDPTVATLLSSQSSTTTVLAPRNSAFDDMPRKPWEDPRDYAAYGPNAYDDEQQPSGTSQPSGTTLSCRQPASASPCRQPSDTTSSTHQPSSASSSRDGKSRADANLRRFVESHLIPQVPWPRGARVATLAGRQIWWDWAPNAPRPDSDSDPHTPRVIMPDGVRVERVANPVANGQVWILNGVLQVP